MAIQVRALEPCFSGGRRYKAGDVFILEPGKKPGKGLEVVAQVDAPKVKVKKAAPAVKEPETLSELNRLTTGNIEPVAAASS